MTFQVDIPALQHIAQSTVTKGHESFTAFNAAHLEMDDALVGWTGLSKKALAQSLETCREEAAKLAAMAVEHGNSLHLAARSFLATEEESTSTL